MRPPERLAALALLLAGVLPASAGAQALSCALPESLPRPREALAPPSDPARIVPVTAYTLALSWSPQYCRQRNGEGASFQCGGRSRFGFILHGLWPDGDARQSPQYCRPVAVLPPRLLRDMLCTTPSVDLIQHEWAKHGSCGADRDPAAYFGKAKALYAQLRFPDMVALSYRRDLTVGDFRDAFARANAHVPGVTPASVRVRITRDRWLSEVWLCLDKGLAHARCGRGQQPGYALPLRLKIWRGGTGAIRR
ncbi:ribonuclease T [Sphingobium sufflavum]|uniref:ribonuclease T2 family protein n=1 Tax=Sphingobium sufflavum TaxID=1129547 RepID=UPI001F316C6E|nr:ribonuclease T [Sphingobium sufflavum]MCE7797811.1 ribonuclease T [Sphingobium sufflavum]